MENKDKNIKEKSFNDSEKIRGGIYILTYILITFVILYTIANFISTNTNFYNENLQFRWNSILSYDDMFYARRIYNSDPNYSDNVSTIVKHPMISAVGQMFTSIEEKIFDNDASDHYFHIVVFQIIINAVGIFYLYKILRYQLELKNKWCFLLLTIYEMATVTILGTLLVESFIISGTLLIMSYYFLSRQKVISSIILGILVTGITITNSIAFALMTIFLIKDKKKIVKIGIFCIIGILLISLIVPYREYLYNNFFSAVDQNLDASVKNQDIITFFKMIFYNICASPIFYLKQIHTVQNGLDFVSFDLSSGKIIAITTIIFDIFLIYNIIKNIKNRYLNAAFSVLIYNVFLHVILKFGLYEGTIYGLHFLFTEIIILAFGFKNENDIIKRIFIYFAIILLCIQIKYNLNGMLNLLLLLKNWN